MITGYGSAILHPLAHVVADGGPTEMHHADDVEPQIFSDHISADCTLCMIVKQLSSASPDSGAHSVTVHDKSYLLFPSLFGSSTADLHFQLRAPPPM